jgi:hypothetical protein
MQQLWFNQNGILHDGIGLLLCSYCPCDVPPSGSSSSSSSGSGSGSGSSGPCGCCYTFNIQSSLDGGGLCGEPAGGNVCGCVEFTDYPTQVCSGGAWSVTFQLNISTDCEGDLTGAVLEFPAGWTITNNGGGSVSGQVVTFTTTDPNATFTVSGTIDEFYSCDDAQVSILGYVTPLQIERGVQLVYDCQCFEPCTVNTSCCPDNPVPMSLTVTFTGGSCAGTYTMNWFSDTSEWISEDAPITLRMTCEEFGWYLSSDGFAESPVSVTCSPFELVFSIFSDPFCGDFTITITG